MDGWVANHVKPILDSILYSVIGTIVLLATFWVIERVLPFSITHEIAEDQNVGLGIILGAFIIGISIIISSAIRG